MLAESVLTPPTQLLRGVCALASDSIAHGKPVVGRGWRLLSSALTILAGFFWIGTLASVALLLERFFGSGSLTGLSYIVFQELPLAVMFTVAAIYVRKKVSITGPLFK